MVSGYPVLAILAGGIACHLLATVVASRLVHAGFPLPPPTGRVGCIDGLRGYLALSVLIHHFVIWMQVSHMGGKWGEPGIAFFHQLGAGGVALFFMTTGLVFYPRILAGFRAASWPAIYIARVLRIVPLVVVSVAAIVTVIASRTGRGIGPDLLPAAAQWITTWAEPPLLDYPDSGRLNAYVLWSLWIEWLFYLTILPLCAFVMDRMRGRLPSWIIPIALGVASVLARLLDLPMTMPVFLPLFASGMLAWEIARHPAIARRLRSRGAAVVAIAALLCAMLVFRRPYGVALPMFAFFFLCVACGNDLFGALRTRGALALGECSFGIYLFHGILLSIVFVDGAGITGRIALAWLPMLLPIAGVAIVLVAATTYLLVERPAMRAGRSIVRAWTGRAIRTGPPVAEVAP